MDKIIALVAMSSINVFFILSSILGYEYKGIEDSSVYVFYVVMVALLGFGLIPYYFFGRRIVAIRRIEIFFLIALPIFVSCSYFLENLLRGASNPVAEKFFSYFFLWTMPSIYAAVYVSKKNIFNSLAKWFELIMLIIILSIITNMLLPLAAGFGFSTLGGTTYQAAAYFASYAFGLNLYFLFYGANHDRFRFAKYRAYRILCLIILPIQALGLLLAGGRGGLVLFAVYFIYIFFSLIGTSKVKRLLLGVLVFMLMICGAYLLSPLIAGNEYLSAGAGRAFEFISPGGSINWEGTSGRDIVYEQAVDLISQKPLLGYGLYGLWDYVDVYPHNIFLEILLNGGCLYLIFSIAMAIFIINKLRKIISVSPENRLIVVLILYPVVMLMFSGTYMTNSEFWFLIVLVVLYEQRSTKLA